MLCGQPIEYTAIELPEYLGDKGDINDLWKWHNFDTAEFVAEVENLQADLSAIMVHQAASTACPPLEDTVDVAPQKSALARQSMSRLSSTPVDWFSETSQWIKDEVMPALNQRAPVINRQGRREIRRCPDPNHTDANPSFSISYDRSKNDGIPQCSCHIQEEPDPWGQVAQWVGARPFMVWYQERKQTHRGGSANPTFDRSTPISTQNAVDGELGNRDTIDCGETETLAEDELEEALFADFFSSLENETPAQSFVNAAAVSGEPPTDDEIGDALIVEWDGKYAFFLGRWHQYDQGYWLPAKNISKPIWDGLVANKGAGVRPSSAKVKSVADYLCAQLFVDDDNVNCGEGVINLRNGLYDLRENCLKPHDPLRYLTKRLEFDFDPEATCPVFESFLTSSARQESEEQTSELCNLVQEAVGYSLAADINRQVSFWVYGPSRTGKSTFLNSLQKLFGTAALTVDLSALKSELYCLADVPGARILVCT